MLTFAEFIHPYVLRCKTHKVRTNRQIARDDDNQPFTWYDEEEQLTDESYHMMLNAYEEWEEIEKLQIQARNELYKIEVKKEIKKGKLAEYVFKNTALTICPPPEYATVEHIQKIAEIACMPSAFKTIFYVLEQRSIEGQEEHGWHVHMSISSTYPPSKVKQFAKQRLDSRGYVFTCKRAYEAVEEFNDGFREMYMKGIKNHVDKDPKVKKDVILRAQYNLQDYYIVEK